MLTRNPNLSPAPSQPQISNQVQARFAKKWWTGKSPENCPGFDSKRQSLLALPLLNMTTATREKILNYFDNSWTLTELLFQSLKTDEVFVSPPYHGLRHPLIFYYGHPAVLFLNKLRVAGLYQDPVDLYLEKVLETGVDEMSWDDLSKNEMTWPSVESVHAYRQKIYNIIRDLILNHPDLDQPSIENLGPKSKFWALLMGFEHEKIHFETSSVLIRELPVEWLEVPKFFPALNESRRNLNETLDFVVSKPWQKIEGQEITWGKSIEANSYGWDNEYGTRTKKIKDFEVTSHLITNAEYYQFVKSGAYIQDSYWSEEGLRWRKFRNTKRPTFWLAYGPEGLHDYKLRTLFEIINMPWDWPAEVNFHEAKAYCAWKNEKDQSKLKYRLITEPEHVAMRDQTEDSVLSSSYLEKFNFNFTTGSASSVDSRPANSKNIYDLFGNVWHWAEDQFNPLDGFQVHPFYDDFSTPCFDGKHQMIFGGSFMSCGHEASQFARFHFRPHFFQHAGFRMARTLDGSDDNGSTKLSVQKNYVHPVRKSVLDQMKNSNWWRSQEFDQPLQLSPSELSDMWLETTKVMQDLENNISKASAMGTALDGETHHLKKDFIVPHQTTREFPARPADFEKSIKLIVDELAPLGQRPGHPGYMAYVAGAGNPISVMAQALAMTLNPYSAHFTMAPGLVSLEAEALKWFIHLVGLPESTAAGLFTTGGSLANLQALAIARNAKLKTTEFHQARFYASAQVHHCIGKALAFLGFSKESLNLIEVDSEFRMKPDLLEKQILEDRSKNLIPVAIIASAGTTNTGAIDPLQIITKIAKDQNIWLHVDGAYGAPFLLTPTGREKLNAIAEADSVALDPHKAMSLPYGTGLLLVRDRQNLRMDFSGSSTYMPPSPGMSNPLLHLDFADIGPELSRDFRGLRIWLPIKTLGIEPFKLNLEEKLELSHYFYDEISKIDGLISVSKPQLTIQTFRHQNKDLTQRLMGLVNSKNRSFLSGCRLPDGTFVIRVCLLGHHLHFEQVQVLIKDLKQSLIELKNQ